MSLFKLPKTSDRMWTLVYVTVIACVTKFIFEGVSFTLGGTSISLGHADALTYGALLGPILGAHSYVKVKGPKQKDEDGDGIPDAK